MITELVVLVIGQFYGMACLPDLPQMSFTYCTENGLLENRDGLNLRKCIDLCERRKLCESVSYNSFSKMCTLRSNVIEPAITDGPPKCIHVAIGNIHPDISELLGGCSDRQCDNNQVCISKNQGEKKHDCVTEYCLTPSEIPNATLISNIPVKVGDSNVFFCDNGFTGIGHNKIDCLSNGTFSYSDFKCYRNCPPIASIPSLADDVEIISVSSFQTTINTTVTLSCSTVDGASLKETTIKCDEFGQWSDISCIALCPFSALPELENGYPNVQNHYAEDLGSEVEYMYMCNDGHIMSTGSSKVTCNSDRQWSALTVTCTSLMYCRRQELKHVENAEPWYIWISSAYWIEFNTFRAGARFMLWCSNGYSLMIGDGSTIISSIVTYATCQTNGEWEYDEEDMKCLKNCQYPDTVPYTNSHEISPYGWPYCPGTTVTFTCVYGYSSRNLVKTCNTTGEWVGDVHCLDV